MPLTVSAINGFKPQAKVYKKFDGDGLFLRIEPNGAKLWRLKYSFKKRECILCLGKYPDMTLALAREKRREARETLAAGINPAEARQAAKGAKTFSEIAESYLEFRAELAPKTVSKFRWILRDYLYPTFGHRPLVDIALPEIIPVLKAISDPPKPMIETAYKAKELMGQIWKFAVSRGLPGITRNIIADMTFVLPPLPDKHLAAITDPVQVGALLRSIDSYSGAPQTVAALKLLPHVFLRSSELRWGLWSEIDFAGALWRIPGVRTQGANGMKMKRDHIVPLSRQSIAILRDLQQYTGHQAFIFPAVGPKKRPLSDVTLNQALHLLGYPSSVHVPHGFRTTASTLLHELGYNSDDIEIQLAHTDSNKIREIYKRAERLAERKRMMQEYSDYLDQLRDSVKVASIDLSAITPLMKASTAASDQRTA